MKHSLGPWSFDGTRQLYGRYKPRNLGSFIKKNIGSVKRLLSKEETEANVVLMQSSPELLLALIEMMPMAETGLEAMAKTATGEEVKRTHEKIKNAWTLLERFK